LLIYVSEKARIGYREIRRGPEAKSIEDTLHSYPLGLYRACEGKIGLS